jgi:hypothetical protein
VIEAHLGDQGVGIITKIPLPIRTDPGKLAIRPDPEPEGVPAHVILLPHVGEVKVPDPVILVKTDEEPVISDRDVTGHANLLEESFSRGENLKRGV